jgi:hypothetical protein
MLGSNPDTTADSHDYLYVQRCKMHKVETALLCIPGLDQISVMLDSPL